MQSCRPIVNQTPLHIFWAPQVGDHTHIVYRLVELLRNLEPGTHMIHRLVLLRQSLVLLEYQSQK